MKKTLLTIMALSFIISISVAQKYGTDFRDKLQFGAKVGTNYSNVYDTEGEEFDANGKFGLATGIFVKIPIGTYFGFQPEAMFSQKGYKATGQLFGTHYSLTRTTNFIDVPLFFNMKPSEFISIVVGPQYSYLISQKLVFDNGVSTIAQEEEFENENIRKNTFGLVAGIDITIKHIVISGRAGFDMFRNNGDGTSTTPRYKNMYIQATVGYRFYTEDY